MLGLVRYLRQERIQIVNSHLFRATLFAAPLARLAGVPAVIETTHGPESWRRSWWKRSFIIDRVIERFVAANIAVSEANREYLVRQKRYPARKIAVIPNGRDLALYAAVPDRELCRLRERYGLSREDRVITAVARLEPQKGHRYLLAALPAILRRFPDVKLLLIGDGSLRPELERMAADLKIRENVIFAGFVSPAAPYYFLAEFIVLPSLYEGMPLVAIEAGAAGKAIVATDVDGTREVVQPGLTGLLVRPADADALADAVGRLLAEPEVALRMGGAAQQRVREDFTIEGQVSRTSREYQQCAVQCGVAA